MAASSIGQMSQAFEWFGSGADWIGQGTTKDRDMSTFPKFSALPVELRLLVYDFYIQAKKCYVGDAYGYLWARELPVAQASRLLREEFLDCFVETHALAFRVRTSQTPAPRIVTHQKLQVLCLEPSARLFFEVEDDQRIALVRRLHIFAQLNSRVTNLWTIDFTKGSCKLHDSSGPRSASSSEAQLIQSIDSKVQQACARITTEGGLRRNHMTLLLDALRDSGGSDCGSCEVSLARRLQVRQEMLRQISYGL
ncbi:hypothetical protein Slin15195_G116460 [Septoria linicola]|uniref:Uncharacterized protein n=1 Tax=Septoria linicola TaxID=215465 RepID=A0A9Q9AYH5_9PEZI|nr:hypothetical protein Slin15195_G116460 [Septoria linicola]